MIKKCFCSKSLAILGILTFLGGCATTSPQLSPMQMRQFTTRTFDGSYEDVFRATMTVLQDHSYIIKNTDMNSGLIVAQVDRETSKGSQFWQAFWVGYVYDKGTLIEASATINKLNATQSEIRMIIQEVVYGQLNSKTNVKTIEDPKIYDAVLNDVQIEVKRREAVNKGTEAKPASVQAAQAAPPATTDSKASPVQASTEDKAAVDQAFGSATSK